MEVIMNIELRDITKDNWLQCIRLKVASDQTQFVASNAVSLAQSKYETNCVPLGIYDGEEMVGFTMYAIDEESGDYWIYRLMVDQKHQKKGYGRAAMIKVIELLKQKPDCKGITLSYEPDNIVAKTLYVNLGFVETGEIIHEEEVAKLTF
jgi:diamine N-acetyltransferase